MSAPFNMISHKYYYANLKFPYLHFFFLSHNFNFGKGRKEMVQIKVTTEMLEEVANCANNTSIA
ncbi:hypothetical protein AS54_4873 [Bacillus cereus 03BB102]|uniref:Uncharacterized protein n=2 Tax=Bacillus cereus TaxID=1396 RepID=A0AAN0T0Z6_BACCE|nr:conserved hypothetical protein [Bacillus cereus 03BB102]AJG60405.1 hypothetical protein AW22_5434 [Bacillus cereus D17]AJH70860.1 hypothetical protein BF32_2425 [Bacillus thuringiensis]AJI14150.1 hypothetical protein AK40_3434 [Bacillus cereus 03BB108]KXY67885.1 hypothetical protein AT275_25810 [Bacillus cereus]